MNTRRKQALMSWVMALMILFSTFSPMSTAIALEPITTAEITEGAGDEGIGAVASGSIKSAGESSASQREESEDPTVPKSQTKKTSWLDNLYGASLFSSGSVSSGTPPTDRTSILGGYNIKLLQGGKEIDDTSGEIDPKLDLELKIEFEVPVRGGLTGTPAPEDYVATNDTARFKLGKGFEIIDGHEIPIMATDLDGKPIQLGIGTFGIDADGEAVLDIVFNNDAVFGEDSDYTDVFARFEASFAF